MKKYRHAIIVGASSGIGAELVRQLADSNCRVAAVARREDRLQELQKKHPNQVLVFVHDVCNVHEAPELFAKITGELGGLDLVIYASGVMPEVGATEYSTKKDTETVDVNILGAVAWLNLAASRFQNTGHGNIVGIGSVAGDRGRAGQPVYNASKAFLATYLEALRNRVSRMGVCVATMKPGPVQTEMTARLGMKNAMPAAKAARLILQKSHRNGEHYLAFSHRVVFYLIKRIPSWIFRRMKL